MASSSQRSSDSIRTPPSPVVRVRTFLPSVSITSHFTTIVSHDPMSQKPPIAAHTLSGAAAISSFFDTEAACAACAARHAALRAATSVIKRISISNCCFQAIFESSNSPDVIYLIRVPMTWAGTKRDMAGNEGALGGAATDVSGISGKNGLAR
jgi:hypothetical protein